MKKGLLIFAAILFAGISLSAQTKSCCVPDVTTRTSMLAMNDAFVKAHLEPLPYKLADPKGEMITFNTPDGKKANGYLIKAAVPSKKYIFLFHEWWGLNEYIKKESEHLYDALKEVNVIAIDMYDGKVASTREDAQTYITALTKDRMEAIITGAFMFAGKKSRVGTLGYCSGGAWSLQAAIIGGKQVSACVMYYGMPEMNIERLKLLKTDVLGIFAEKDNFINVETVKAFEVRMKEAGEKIVVYNYVAEHAFANPSNPQHNAEATKDAFLRTETYLKKNMKIRK